MVCSSGVRPNSLPICGPGLPGASLLGLSCPAPAGWVSGRGFRNTLERGEGRERRASVLRPAAPAGAVQAGDLTLGHALVSSSGQACCSARPGSWPGSPCTDAAC